MQDQALPTQHHPAHTPSVDAAPQSQTSNDADLKTRAIDMDADELNAALTRDATEVVAQKRATTKRAMLEKLRPTIAQLREGGLSYQEVADFLKARVLDASPALIRDVMSSDSKRAGKRKAARS